MYDVAARHAGGGPAIDSLDVGTPGKATQVDSLSMHGEADGVHVDQVGGSGSATGSGTGGGSGSATGGGTGAGSGGGAAAAVPINLAQTLTSWAPGATKYGFQLQFACASSTGSVADLQARPNLKWREFVTYSRNDFAHRISPPNPTILPPGGIPFAAGTTTVTAPNRLDLGAARDTHWMPTSAVRDTDFGGTTGRTLPGIMESSQVYQWSDDGSTWTTFAGPFTLKRTFYNASPAIGAAIGGATGALAGLMSGGLAGAVNGAINGAQAGAVAGAAAPPTLRFSTDKQSIHSVDEAYKP